MINTKPLLMSIGRVFNNQHLSTHHGDEVGSIMPWCNSFSTSLPIMSLSSFPNHHDFGAIGLQLGDKFGKSKGLSTEAAERIQIDPGLEITVVGALPISP